MVEKLIKIVGPKNKFKERKMVPNNRRAPTARFFLMKEEILFVKKFKCVI